MSARRQFVLWVVLAATALLLLVGIVSIQQKKVQRQWAVLFPPKPVEGHSVFRDKGCANCHGDGTQLAPGLRERPSLASLPQLVTAMWNHAPRMWEALEAKKLPYPIFTYEETSQLVSYLYMSGYADEAGDAQRGAQLFKSKNCIRCHAVGEGQGGVGPHISRLSAAETPLAWTQVLWNHASAMQARMSDMSIAWPRFHANELRDLFAYVRQAGGHPGISSEFFATDPGRGWDIFQQKSCMTCHSLYKEPGRVGPELGAQRPLPPTFSQFGEVMLNHFPEMQRAMGGTRTPPLFERQEMTELASFLYSLHYLEPAGSPQVGRSVFSWRGCNQCHGALAEGQRGGPALRGVGRNYTAVRLATELWRHGALMYQQGRKSGQPWPTLKEGDVGDLLAFLNTPLE